MTRAERRRAAEEREILELLIPQDPYDQDPFEDQPRRYDHDPRDDEPRRRYDQDRYDDEPRRYDQGPYDQDPSFDDEPRPPRNGRHSQPGAGYDEDDEPGYEPDDGPAPARGAAVVRMADAPAPAPVAQAVIQPTVLENDPAHPVIDRTGQGMHRREPRLLLEVRVVGMVIKREMKRYFRSKAKILASLVQPFFFLLIFGFGMKAVVATTGGVNFEQYVFPGVMAMIVLSRALMSAVSIVQDSEHGFLREMLVAPASRVSIVIGAIIGGAAISTMQAALLFIGAPVMGLYPSPTTIAVVLAVAILMGLEVTALGVALATIIRKPSSFQATTQAIMYPMLVLSGALVAIGGLPGWLQVIAKFDVFAYPIDALRRLMLGTDSGTAGKVQMTGLAVMGHHLTIADELGFAGLCTIVFMVVAVWRFAKSN